MKGEFPWIYAAMIVIAFVSWVFNRIQEATAGKQRAEELRQRKEDGDFDLEEEDFFEEVESQPVNAPPKSGEDTMRKLMEALGGTVVQAPQAPSREPVPQRQTAPPPVPVKSSQARMTAEERAALDRLKKRGGAKPEVTRSRLETKGARSTIADLVRDPKGIRDAVVLREVLDRPRSERPWD